MQFFTGISRILRQNHNICHHWLMVIGISQIMHCGIPINMSITIAVIVVIYLVFGGRKPQLPTIETPVFWSYVSPRDWLLYSICLRLWPFYALHYIKAWRFLMMISPYQSERLFWNFSPCHDLSTSIDTICVDGECKLASMIVEKCNADPGMSF